MTTTKTELFHRDGRLHSILTETNDGRIVTQEWCYAEDAAPFLGAETGCKEINVRLADDTNVSPGDIEALIDAWRAAVAQPGFRDDCRGGEDFARAFLDQTRGSGVLWATNRPARAA